MKAVSIRDLKARLSEYVRLARRGETILVTDGEDVVAELRPARRQKPPSGTWDEIFDDLAEAGLVTRASLPKEGWTWKSAGLGLPEGTAEKILDELREDRFK
jgi:antitoxin (DNA-binding transcriptional repressor) of toxin-antitoxin stability system